MSGRSVVEREGDLQRELVEQAKGGDHDAFKALVSATYDSLYRLAYRILRDTDRTDDAVQDCLVRAWRELPRLRDPDRFEAWMRRPVVNACYDQTRRDRRQRGLVGELQSDSAPRPDVAADQADRDELERGFQRLTVEQRTVVVMAYYLGMPAAEIGRTLGIPTATVQSRLRRAIGTMRAGLEADARPLLAPEGGRRR